MSTRRDKRASQNAPKKLEKTRDKKLWGRLEKIFQLFVDPKLLTFLAVFFVHIEIIMNLLIIHNVKYTEIDWRAYMQEVEGFLNGTLDYGKLRGDTGPLVYPAGFVYIYSLFYYMTSNGIDVRTGQYIFALLYIVLLVLVFRIYARTKKVPPYVLILIFCTSYRVHSIFVLRLFNDSVAMIFLFASLNAFLDDKWYWGSVLYSLAVSVKMNILLFSPALLIFYVCNLGFVRTIFHLAICATIQIILGLPFLINNPYTYICGAFNFGRVFEYKWTVNWRIIPQDLFLNPVFHITLLFLHLAAIAYFIPTWKTYMRCYAKLKLYGRELKLQMKKETEIETVDMSTVSQLFIAPLFVANFLGVMFSRSLHYQFYVWYYHTLPYIAWCTHYSVVTRIAILVVLELCWNVYPSTVWSSAALHGCHLMLLYGLHKNRVRYDKFDKMIKQ
ncbi:lethal(2)neighbour of Tid protein [Fopius arisanus]|uniref:dolichyl-P-Man:Man5GlcNAc2-PP-dolichol alpha-1,3-mannosyltransferase n=1 Tax=Fopius arisanus TaxID=64838 RepID=A0A9R1TK01_9HYME|nr:PREDICTED: lethal(2)neighbour of Tid protein [Fopius arisanus]XP_011310645.1 PREDICTED: lethal(2)neighbour of Tid protein [Fopius arisanus]